MADQPTAAALADACATISGAIRDLADADLDAGTPCQDWNLRKLLTHFLGTTTAFTKAGSDKALDEDDPWGAQTKLSAPDNWRAELSERLDTVAGAWSTPHAWEGEVRGSGMSARSLGEMGLIEIALHGWDVITAAGGQLRLTGSTAAEVLRCVTATAEQGRQFEAYGPQVHVADGASDYDQALALAGRDPAWPASSS